MATKQPMIGPGIFQWNGGGWFGAQLGSTVWMLLAAGWIAPVAPQAATIGVLCFAAPNALGMWLWQRRDRILPHTAIQVLVLSICGAGLVTLLTFDWSWPPALPRESLRPAYAVCLFMPLVIMRWYLVEQWAMKRRREVEADVESGTGADMAGE
jgi:uncharacterized membrane protein YfcA